MLCPKCEHPLNIEEITREHGYVKLPSVEWLKRFFSKRMAKNPTANLNFIKTAQALNDAMQKGEVNHELDVPMRQ